MLVDKNHFSQSEVDFYRLWISDLDSIGYKWPSIDSNSRSKRLVDNKSVSVYFKSIEQDHSSNSNANEKSNVQNKHQQVKLAKIKSLCQFPVDKNIELDRISKINDIILVTWINSSKDLDLISNVINIHFSYIIGCFSSKIDEITNINGITLIEAINFQHCVYNAVNIGFKQNSFIFAKSINNFKFWSDAIKLVDSNKKINLIELENDQKVKIIFFSH